MTFVIHCKASYIPTVTPGHNYASRLGELNNQVLFVGLKVLPEDSWINTLALSATDRKLVAPLTSIALLDPKPLPATHANSTGWIATIHGFAHPYISSFIYRKYEWVYCLKIKRT